MLDDLDALLDGCKLVAIAHVSNTLGTIAPLETIVPRAHAAGAVVLVDGAQAAPHMPVDVKALDVDFYAFSGHKMLGPTGIGVLYGKRALLEAMPPFLSGGDMIRKVEYAQHDLQRAAAQVRGGHQQHRRRDRVRRRGRVSRRRRHGVGPRARAAAHRLRARAARASSSRAAWRSTARATRALISGVISFNFADVHAHDLASILDTEGVCVRAGHHCTMPLMEKMGWPATARASFYIYNTEADVDALCAGSKRPRASSSV